ncbi:MAG: SWIM zinc finger family protein, partial [Chitinophagaceae bacterium]
MNLSEEQILALAPDESSKKSGKELSNASKWVSKGANETALWGECKGSGSKPYQTQVDLANIAFKCSCPSRKFPCKHGLGLL